MIAVIVPEFDPAERFVAREQAVQRTEFAQRICRERPDGTLANESPEPLAQGPGLVGALVQFPRLPARLQGVQLTRRSEPRLRQPVDQAISIVEPIDGRIDR